jgi:hypothetical protein
MSRPSDNHDDSGNSSTDSSSDESDDDRRRRKSSSRRKEKKRMKKEERRREKKKDRKKKDRKRRKLHHHDDSSRSSEDGSAVAERSKVEDRPKSLSSLSHGKRRKADHPVETDPSRGEERKRSKTLHNEETTSHNSNASSAQHQSLPVPPTLRKSSMAPMSQAEYEAQHQQIRAVFDPTTGRTRMTRGTGEIIESIVSRAQHQSINQMATRGDGDSFARQVYQEGRRRRKER